MARTGVQGRLLPAQRPEYEPASSREARVRSAEILLLQPDQTSGPQSHAIAVPAQRQTPATIARQRYRCDRFPLLQQPTRDSRRTPEPGALLGGCDATHRGVETQSRPRKAQMRSSMQRWTPESQSLHGKKAAPPLDMGWADPGCSRCEFPRYASP